MKISTFDSQAIFIGLMSGTSVDAIDAVAVSFKEHGLHIHQSHSHSIPRNIKQLIIELNTPSENELYKFMYLDQCLGDLFAEATLSLLKKANLTHRDISAIGSHGQTIRHQIEKPPFSTLQIGNANRIAEKTGICTLADFRSRDMVLGGQGAPLVPAFHQAIFKDKKDRIILNIGGMANLTLLWANKDCQGFDTGPGNVLMDTWIQKQKQEAFDKNGDWAKCGKVNQSLLQNLLQESFFKAKPPKSTGRDLFNARWLESKIKSSEETLENIQATLLALTTESIALAIEQWGPKKCEIYVCGGGANNSFLMQSLSQRLKTYTIASTSTIGLDPNWVEACAFAWLAKQTLEGKTGNLASVTGARKNSILGAIYPAPSNY